MFLLTAISNHGNTNCAGLAEIKFNLMPEDGVAIPTNEENEETEEEDGEEEEENVICSAVEEIIVEEVFAREAFLYWEYEIPIAIGTDEVLIPFSISNRRRRIN